MSEISLYRREILNTLIPYAQQDPRIHVLVCDMGFGVADRFAQACPGRILNMGIMEQGTVGIAAGMALSGLKPVVYSIVNFLAFRSLEQIRNDVVLQGLGVKFIATGVNDYFKFLGKSHCCGQDDKEIMKIIGMRVYDPYEGDESDFPRLVKEWIESKESAYMRV